MSRRPSAWLPTALALLFAGSILVLGGVDPGRYALLLQEDGHVEWMTVWAFMLGCAMFGFAAVNRARGRERIPLILLALFSLLVAGEEISWGQRLLTFQPPELFLESNYQQESNFHNLLKGIFDSRWQVFTIAAGYGVVAPVVVQRGWLSRDWAPPMPVIPALLAVAALELSYPLTLTGELAEALLALAFLHDAAFRTWPEHGRSGLRTCLSMALALTLGACTPATLDRVLYQPDAASTDLTRQELEALGDHVSAHAKRRMFGKRRVHKRVYTAIQAGYLAPREEAPAASIDVQRRRYALDPWQQPYWLLHVPGPGGRGEVLLYSFGPNRRRDTLVERMPDRMNGDDIAVRLAPMPAPTARGRPR